MKQGKPLTRKTPLRASTGLKKFRSLSRTASIKKKSKSPLKKAKDDAWDAFSRYIRLRDSLRFNNSPEVGICYTCKKQYPNWGKGCLQAGHFVQGRHNSYLFDERGVHAQCYHCNVGLKGNWPFYLMYMRMDYGEDVVAELIGLYTSHKPHPMKAFQYRELETKYKEIIAELQEKLKGGEA